YCPDAADADGRDVVSGHRCSVGRGRYSTKAREALDTHDSQKHFDQKCGVTGAVPYRKSESYPAWKSKGEPPSSATPPRTEQDIRDRSSQSLCRLTALLFQHLDLRLDSS